MIAPWSVGLAPHAVHAATLTLLCASLACAASGDRPVPDGAHAATTITEDSAAIDSLAARYFAMGLAPGMAVAVVRGDSVVYLGGFGAADRESGQPVTPATIFYIASTTKAFTGLTAAILDDRGTLDLDAPLSRYVPDVRLQRPLSAEAITIRALLTHTHGISNDGPVVWRTAYTGEFTGNGQLVALLGEHPPARGGRAFEYGNIGYNIAGIAIDRALGRSWRDVLADEIFGPLGMTSTSACVTRVPAEELAMPYDVHAVGFGRIPYGKADANMQAAGGLVSSAVDMARWLEAQLNAGRVDGRQVLPAVAIAEAQRMQAPANRTQRGMRQIGYALGWNLVLRGDDTLYVHGGGFPGFATLVSFLPRARLGVVVMANDGSLGGTLTDVLTRAIYARLVGAAPGADVPGDIEAEVEQVRRDIAADRAQRAARSQVLPFPLEAYAGVYENPSYGTLELRSVNGRLEARAGAASSPVEVFDATRNRLRVELTGRGTVMDVEMRNGRATRLTLQGNTFVRRTSRNLDGLSPADAFSASPASGGHVCAPGAADASEQAETP